MTDRVSFIEETQARLQANERHAREAAGLPTPRVMTPEERAEAEWQAGAPRRQLNADFYAMFGGERTAGPASVAWQNDHQVDILGYILSASALLVPILSTPQGRALAREILNRLYPPANTGAVANQD